MTNGQLVSKRFTSPAGRLAKAPAVGRFPGGHLGGPILVLGSLLFTGMISWLDYRIGPYLSLSVLYLMPVAACAWWGGWSHGVLLALAGSVAWQIVDSVQNPLIPAPVGIWNGVTRFGTLFLIASLISRLHAGLLREWRLARTDSLTGAANARTFYEVAGNETGRACRSAQPMTLAYLDLDNFKKLNDSFGHAAGDQALVQVVDTIRLNIRGSDLLARLGGDEFALLLPDTGPDGAGALLARLQVLVAQAMADQGWPVTVSIGAATFLCPDWDVDFMIRRVDNLLYQAKEKGKSRLEHAIVSGRNEPRPEGAQAAERRAAVRLICNRPARVRRNDDVEVFATVRDLSTDGVGLVLSERFPKGAILVAEPVKEGPRTLLARVVRSCRVEGGWLHGCELSPRLHEADLLVWRDGKMAKAHP